MFMYKISRNVFYTVVGLAAALVAGCSAFPSQVASAGGSNPAQSPVGTPAQVTAPTDNRGITVVGTGKASGTPDVAVIQVGVETQSPTVQQAVADNKTQMTKLLAALKDAGIADADISTTNFSVYTERQPQPVAEPGSKSGADGSLIYHVSNQVQVKVRDVAKLGDVLDQVVAAGANNIYGVSFSVADTSKLEGDARANAIADAKARAESLAKLAGVSLGDVQSVSEVISGQGPIAYRTSESAGLGGGTPIQPGTLEVNVSVQVTYAI
jgi:uncharacterized protein